MFSKVAFGSICSWNRTVKCSIGKGVLCSWDFQGAMYNLIAFRQVEPTGNIHSMSMRSS